ncbi:MAG TPA: NnrS family protein [Gammaproteobacteria bacterium]|jgi:uncharacterized protein involved in response to NO|nr:NnrS family protein [Gammaproteobacteria bacterium]
MFFFDRAFRSFFLGGAVFASLAMWVWWWNYPLPRMPLAGVVPLHWHAHEMVFGYALATVTGFLLTAVMNWTGANSASGRLLALIFAFWVGARLGYLINSPLWLIALLDLSFALGLFLHFVVPIIRARQWKQMGLASKFLMLFLANALFYAGVAGWYSQGADYGITLGLFLVLAINLTMMRRLIPFFTEKALGLPEMPNSKWIDIFAIVGFLALMIAAAFFPTHWATSVIAFPLAATHLIRAVRWYHPRIWRITLLWPLHVSYAFMISGMLLYGFTGLDLVNESQAIHGLAAGGIGLLCSSIMARIGLGHTNRNVFEPPASVNGIFALLAATAVVRVFMPIAFPSHYILWIHLAQWGWSLAFLWLAALYWPILARPEPESDSGLRLL